MTLSVRPLPSTRFRDLDLRSLHMESRLPRLDQTQWKAVVDDRNGVIFTQLLGPSSEMRDGIYYYLLAVGRQLFVLESGSKTLEVVNSGLDGSYPLLGSKVPETEILLIAKHAMREMYERNSPTSSTVAILDVGGQPMQG